LTGLLSGPRNGDIVPRFKVGEKVERIGSLVPRYMKRGIVLRVIPNEYGQDWFTEYEVNFGGTVIAKFYETQLRPADDSNDDGSTLS
jgi:hypothetical protein